VDAMYAGTGAALLSLDRTWIGQWMLSRPVILGTALGWVLGDLPVGWWIGLLFEALSLDAEPVGGVIPLNGTIATAATLLIALGGTRVPLAAAFPAGLAFGLLYRPVEEKIRRRRDAWTGQFASVLREGGSAPWGKAFTVSFLEEFAIAALVLTAGVAASSILLQFLWGWAPTIIRTGFEDALSATPLIAAGALISCLLRKDRLGK